MGDLLHNSYWVINIVTIAGLTSHFVATTDVQNVCLVCGPIAFTMEGRRAARATIDVGGKHVEVSHSVHALCFIFFTCYRENMKIKYKHRPKYGFYCQARHIKKHSLELTLKSMDAASLEHMSLQALMLNTTGLVTPSPNLAAF